jgi:hypothetical protein
MTVKLDTIPELINEVFDPVFAEILARNTFFLSRFPVRGSTAERLKWRAHISGNTSVGSYGEVDGLGTAGNQGYTTAELAWKLNKVLVEVTGLAQAVSQGEGFVRDLLQNELEEALPDLQAEINSQIMSDGTGNGGKDLTGLYAAIDDGTDVATYAGVTRAGTPEFAAYCNRNGGVNRALTLALMRDVKRTVEAHPRNGRVTAIYCGDAQWDNYGTLLIGATESKRNYNDNLQVLAGGYQALFFEGVPVIKIPGYNAHRMDFVDERWFTYYVLRNFVTEKLAKTKDVDTFFMKHYSQLRCKIPYKQGSLRDLT